MQYLGGKARLAKHILPVILKDRKPNQWYIEPFLGGANTFHLVDYPKLGSDIHPELIAMYKAMQNGWIPPDSITKEQYNHIRYNQSDYPPELVAFVAFGCSFGGIEWSGYAKDNTGRNYALNAKNSLLKQMIGMYYSSFVNLPYFELDSLIPENSIIYCDPPYQNSTKYKTDDFNHEMFWQWCRDKSLEGHSVFITEFSAPSDFKIIYQKERISSTSRDSSKYKSNTEFLFTFGG